MPHSFVFHLWPTLCFQYKLGTDEGLNSRQVPEHGTHEQAGTGSELYYILTKEEQGSTLISRSLTWQNFEQNISKFLGKALTC